MYGQYKTWSIVHGQEEISEKKFDEIFPACQIQVRESDLNKYSFTLTDAVGVLQQSSQNMAGQVLIIKEVE